MKKFLFLATTLILVVAVVLSCAACNVETNEELLKKYADNIAQEMRGCFDFFWKEAQTDEKYPDAYGLIPDRSGLTKDSPASIASVGFGLAAYVVGVEENLVTKAEAEERTLGTLETVLALQKSDTDVSHEGFLTHFINMKTAKRVAHSEISSIDTAIMLCGALTAGEYFGNEVKALAEEIYANVNWTAMRIKKGSQACIAMTFDYNEQTGEFGKPVGPWDYYAEQLMIYVLGAGSPTEEYRLDDKEYYAFTRQQGNYGGHKFYYSWFGSIFTYQFSHAFVNFNGLVDKKGTDWWNNSVEASLAAYEYCRDNSSNSKTFAEGGWGLTACDAPNGYSGDLGNPPRGWNPDASYANIEGTVAPCGAIGSVVFTPKQSLEALAYYQNTDTRIFQLLNRGNYGLRDSYNLDRNFVADDYIGIDKGISLVMLYNYKCGGIWEQFMANQHVKNGMTVLGFSLKAVDL